MRTASDARMSAAASLVPALYASVAFFTLVFMPLPARLTVRAMFAGHLQHISECRVRKIHPIRFRCLEDQLGWRFGNVARFDRQVHTHHVRSSGEPISPPRQDGRFRHSRAAYFTSLGEIGVPRRATQRVVLASPGHLHAMVPLHQLFHRLFRIPIVSLQMVCLLFISCPLAGHGDNVKIA
jgi:hypothetical protein